MVDARKYVVLDVETNGIPSKEYDLLSISIYMPDKNIFFDRYLPLELQNKVLTTKINGITKKMLKGAKPLSQDEFDEIVENYELKERTILTYSNLDKHFMKSYLKRHGIIGFEALNFKNIKEDIISTSYTNGLLTKDNLCRAFGIKGVIDVHSGHNDCLLEWKLFDFMNGRKLFVSYTHEFCPPDVKHNHDNWYIYELTRNYIVPVSFLHSHPKFKKILCLPEIDLEFKKCFEHEFSKKCSPNYSYQPAGIACEHLLYSMINAEYQDSFEFLLENKCKLRYLGRIEAEEVETTEYYENTDGTLSAVQEKDSKIIHAINKQTLAIKKEIGNVVNYIKGTIFGGKKILSQELIVNKQYNMLGLCDFSNENACLEVKWNTSAPTNQKYLDEFKYQLYITSNNRPAYIIVLEANKLTIFNVVFSIK